MSIKAILSKVYAAYIFKRVNFMRNNAIACQKKEFDLLVSKARYTSFGINHNFEAIHTYEDFKNSVPLRDYEQLSDYIHRVKKGEVNVLWPGKPLYLSKTSGTTSGTKYIPISRDSISNHIKSARNALLMYIHETGNSAFVSGKMIFLSGSPVLEKIAGILTGRLSGIVNHHVPAYLRGNQVPSLEVNSIEDWELKIEAIISEIVNQPLSLISGIPPWVQMFFDRLQVRYGKTVSEIFPDLALYVYGGVNYEPYRTRLENSMGGQIDTIETYPASEGFIAYQDTRQEPGLLLVADAGIYYEFVPLEEIEFEKPSRLSLAEVKCDKNYALVLNTNAGLWGYILGDTVRFVSLNPFRIVVSGRIKHFISAFGEHVIGEEVDFALQSVAVQLKTEIVEFTVAPKVDPEIANELPYHEWFIEFGKLPDDLAEFSARLDKALQEKNSYYKDLIQGNILQPLKIRKMKRDTFIKHMRAEGRLGGQNKVPHLANNRDIADKLKNYIESLEIGKHKLY